jgi:hypothetical protein
MTLLGGSSDEALHVTRPDLLEPFATQVSVSGVSGLDTAGLVAALLEDIARRCVDAGSPLIGHIKCHVEAGETRFHCHVTSLRSGARCEGGVPPSASALSPAEAGVPLSAVVAVQMDLAVLVYGLTRETVGVIVRDALGAAAMGGATWSLSAEFSA